MTKYVQLGTSQHQRWEIPEGYDLAGMKTILEGAQERGEVVFIPVLVDGSEMQLRVDGSKLEACGVLQTPEPAPLMTF